MHNTQGNGAIRLDICALFRSRIWSAIVMQYVQHVAVRLSTHVVLMRRIEDAAILDWKAVRLLCSFILGGF